MEGKKWAECRCCRWRDTQGINSVGSPNDNIASDFSTPQFHAINYVSLYYVWFANIIVA